MNADFISREICTVFNLSDDERACISAYIEVAMMEQRNACADAVEALKGRQHTFRQEECLWRSEVYQAVMNAEVKNG